MARQRPKHAFDHPFLAGFRKVHEATGLKVQFNLFYRTDFFYGMDEFTLKDVTDAYKAEFAANADWLKLGFHSLQEFPDYPWINADYGTVKQLFCRIRDEVGRFAGPGVLTTACIPHWCPMSRDGCRALKDCGIRIMECSVGPRYRYDGRRERLPYGHGMRLEQNRKPETGFYWRDSRDTAISASICSYNHMPEELACQTSRTRKYVVDRTTGMAFKRFFNDAPVLNLVDVPTLKADLAAALGCEHLTLSDHEQYFYPDYLAYQPDYAEKIRAMAETLAANGYAFVLNEDLIR